MKKLIAYTSVLLALTQCTSSDKPAKEVSNSKSSTNASWANRMKGMADGLQELMPYVYSRQEFSDENNKGSVKKLISNFETSVEVVPQHAGEDMLGKDPLIQFAIVRLKSNTRHALKAFNEGHVEFSRNVLRENLGLCFSCHTTTQFGPENNFTTAKLSSNFRMQPSEKAEYYVATRQFNRAIEVLSETLRTPGSLMDDPHEQVAALKKYLSLQVRVKKDPSAAASLLQSFLNNKNLPYFIATDGESWMKSLLEWQREPKANGQSFKKAQALLRKAKFKQGNQGYQSAFIEYLRASSLLHDGLRETKDPVAQAKIYQLLGQSYETLSETGTWDLPEFYFEACVRTAPKTPVAKQCFKEFERSVVLGFSGSAGIFIPKEERVRMSELKLLSGLK
ncbi:MAG: hypothetical protein KDD38_08840 [Bdellovibrionales bacterium]|nr:hypothetical protein [Bdellovibrionales bacterium]